MLIKTFLFILLTIIALSSKAETVYVNDRVSLSVVAQPRSGQDAITRVQSGNKLESLETRNGYTKVRLENGTEGWVRSFFLTDTEPTSLRFEKASEENQRLKEQVTLLEEQIKILDEQNISPDEYFAIKQENLNILGQLEKAKQDNVNVLFIAIAASFITLLVGIYLGHKILSRRVKDRFGGMKVW